MPTTEQVVRAYQEHGTQRATAEALGCAQSTVNAHLAKVKGTSTLYDKDGAVRLTWVKEDHKREAIAALAAEIVEGFRTELPRSEYILPEAMPLSDLLTVYPVGDHHLGMLSWAEETGASYDIKIGEQLLRGAIARLTSRAPAGSSGLLIFLGDFLHYDSLEAVTPKNRNPLDTDSRFHKIARSAIALMRVSITLCLERHSHVHVIVEPGNHDPCSSILLMEALGMHYENELRVTVDTTPGKFHYYHFGKVLIGTHHGDTVRKMADLPGIMATDRPLAWGSSSHRMWITGHIHKDSVLDAPGCRVESVRILPPSDAWAHTQGYRPTRDMKAIVFHKEHGEIERYVVNPKMVAEA